MKYKIGQDDGAFPELPERTDVPAPIPDATAPEDDSGELRPIPAGSLTEDEVIACVNDRLARDIPEDEIVRELRRPRQSYRATLLLVRRVSAANLEADYEPEVLRFVSERQDKGETDLDIAKELIQQEFSADEACRLLRDVAAMRAEIAQGRSETRTALLVLGVSPILFFINLCLGGIVAICLTVWAVNRHRIGSQRMKIARALLYPRIRTSTDA